MLDIYEKENEKYCEMGTIRKYLPNQSFYDQTNLFIFLLHVFFPIL